MMRVPQDVIEWAAARAVESVVAMGTAEELARAVASPLPWRGPDEANVIIKTGDTDCFYARLEDKHGRALGTAVVHDCCQAINRRLARIQAGLRPL